MMSTSIKTLEELQVRKRQVKVELEQYENRFTKNYYNIAHLVGSLKSVFSKKNRDVQRSISIIPTVNFNSVIGTASMALKGFMFVRDLCRKRKSN